MRVLFVLNFFLLISTLETKRFEIPMISPRFLPEWIQKHDNSQIPNKPPPPPTQRPGEHVRNNVNFILHTKSDPEGTLIKQPIDLKESTFDPKKPTKFIIHGWGQSIDSDISVSIRKGYLKTFDFNVMVMDWEILAESTHYIQYPISLMRLPEVAEHFAEFLVEMIETLGVNPKDVHLIGHSLGGQLAGVTGLKMRGIKLGRITGLDPALPGFLLPIRDQISKESAEFVDVIHTSGLFYGVLKPVGHVDFYPNGGTPPQPGCSVNGFISTLIKACSHTKSWEYYAASLYHPETPLYAIRCASWEDFEDHKCDGNEKIVMGELTPATARGKYYLRTKAEWPYSIESNNQTME